MSDTSTLLLVIMAAVLVSMVLAIVIVRRPQVRASRALADLGGATLTTAATGMGMSGEDAPPLRGTATLALTHPDVAFAHWRPDHLLRLPRPALPAIGATPQPPHRPPKTHALPLTRRAPRPGGGTT